MLYVRPAVLTALLVVTSALAQSGRPLRVAFGENNLPFALMRAGHPSGFEVELMKDVARRLGRPLDWKQSVNDSLLSDLGQDRFDIAIGGQYITGERQKQAEFSEGLYCSSAVLMSTRPLPTFGGLGVDLQKALSNQRIGVQNATSFMAYARNRPGQKTVLVFPNTDAVIFALITKNADVVVLDELGALQAKRDYRKARFYLSKTLFKANTAFALKSGNTGLLGKVNVALRAQRSDGTFGRIAAKYFGNADVRC